QRTGGSRGRLIGCPGPRVHTRGGVPPRPDAHVADEPTRVVVALGDPVIWGLAGTGRRDGGGVCREFQMAEDLANDLPLHDDGDESQHPALTKGTRAHLQGKHALQEPGPGPIRSAPRRLLPVYRNFKRAFATAAAWHT